MLTWVLDEMGLHVWVVLWRIEWDLVPIFETGFKGGLWTFNWYVVLYSFHLDWLANRALTNLVSTVLNKASFRWNKRLVVEIMHPCALRVYEQTVLVREGVSLPPVGVWDGIDARSIDLVDLWNSGANVLHPCIQCSLTGRYVFRLVCLVCIFLFHSFLPLFLLSLKHHCFPHLLSRVRLFTVPSRWWRRRRHVRWSDLSCGTFGFRGQRLLFCDALVVGVGFFLLLIIISCFFIFSFEKFLLIFVHLLLIFTKNAVWFQICYLNTLSL